MKKPGRTGLVWRLEPDALLVAAIVQVSDRLIVCVENDLRGDDVSSAQGTQNPACRDTN